MIERTRIVKQLSHTFVFKISLLVFGFIRFFIISKNFLPETMGAYAIILDTILICRYLLVFSLFNYMVRNVPGKEEGERLSILKNILITELIISFLAIVTIIVTKADIYFCKLVNISDFIDELRLGFLIILLLIIGMDISRYFSVIKEIEFSNWLSFFNNSLWIGIVGILWLFSINIEISTLFFCWIFGLSLNILFGLKRINLLNFLKSRFDTSIIKKAFIFSVPLVLINIGINLISVSDKYILSYYYSPDEVGLYFWAFRPLNMLYDLSAAVAITVFTPYILESHNLNKTKDEEFYISVMLKYTLIIIIPLLIPFLILRKDAIIIISKIQFLESAKIIPFLAVIPILNVIKYPFEFSLFMENKTKFIGGTYLLAASINIILNFILIPKFSYYGAALSSVFSFLFLLVAYIIKTRKYILIKWPLIKIRGIFLVSVLLLITCFYLNNLFYGFFIDLVRIIILIPTILLLFIIGLFVFSVFNEKEINFFKSFLIKIFQ